MEELLPILHKYWGYESFRPLQAEAMRAVVEHRDSVVVMPTRRRQVALLSGAGAVHAGNRRGRVAVDRADEGPIDALRLAGARRRASTVRKRPANAADRRSGEKRATQAALP